MATAVEPGAATARLFERLVRPYDAVRALAALLGVPRRVTRQLVGALLATSDEAEDLLAAMPHILRSMAIATTDRPERCYGEIRGPVLWSETMSARSSSAGDPGLFVCATTTKAYDTVENRVLKHALHVIHTAGRDSEHGLDGPADEVLRRARHNGQHAARLLDHQTLTAVPVERPRPRALQRTRTGSRRATYAPALAVERRAAEPVTVEHLLAFTDATTAAWHELLDATIERVDDRLGHRHPLRNDHGGLAAGPVTFHHPAQPVPEGTVAGIAIHGVALALRPGADGAAVGAAVSAALG